MNSCYWTDLGKGAKPAIADLVWFNEPFDAWIITRINVPHERRGEKLGSALLDRICADADKEGIALMLAPEASAGERGLGQIDLEAWYLRRGFRWTRAGTMMERRPR